MAVFFYLSKAFGTICHKTLLNKLEHYGIRGVCDTWFKSYLSNRSQFTSIDNIQSSLKQLTCGVPQGSILDPILFLIYINDVHHSTSMGLLSFADDTTLHLSGNDFNQLEICLNRELGKLKNWFCCNKLALNVSKTKYSVFSPRHIDHNFEISIDNSTI